MLVGVLFLCAVSSFTYESKKKLLVESCLSMLVVGPVFYQYLCTIHTVCCLYYYCVYERYYFSVNYCVQ